MSPHRTSSNDFDPGATLCGHAPARKEAAVKVLDVHCEIDDGFALCGENFVPRVPIERFIQLGELLANSPPPQRHPWQRCPNCVAIIADEGQASS